MILPPPRSQDPTGLDRPFPAERGRWVCERRSIFRSRSEPLPVLALGAVKAGNGHCARPCSGQVGPADQVRELWDDAGPRERIGRPDAPKGRGRVRPGHAIDSGGSHREEQIAPALRQTTDPSPPGRRSRIGRRPPPAQTFADGAVRRGPSRRMRACLLIGLVKARARPHNPASPSISSSGRSRRLWRSKAARKASVVTKV